MAQPADPTPRGMPTPLREMNSSAPARFESWPSGMYQRTFELWSTVGARNAAATERLLALEAEGAATPAASTVRRWAIADGWDAQADADLERTRGRTLRQLQAGWLGALQLAQITLVDSMTGGLDGLPHGGAARLKAAETVLRTIGQSGLLATLPDPAPPDAEATASLSVDERLRRSREEIRRQKEQADRR
jgi:hypothetical protein